MNHIDPAVWEQRAIRVALADRDVSEVYNLLIAAGVPQRQIADATGQSQSEVSEVLHGRRVTSYNLLVRIADGLGVPRGWMGLAYAGINVAATADRATAETAEEVDENMKRRALLATASLALFDRPILGELLELPAPPESPTPLPSCLVMADVEAMRNLTEQLRVLARQYGGQGETVSAIAVRSLKLMTVIRERGRCPRGCTRTPRGASSCWTSRSRRAPRSLPLVTGGIRLTGSTRPTWTM